VQDRVLFVPQSKQCTQCNGTARRNGRRYRIESYEIGLQLLYGRGFIIPFRPQPPPSSTKVYPSSAPSAPIPTQAYNSLLIPRVFIPNPIFHPRYPHPHLFISCNLTFSRYIHASRMRSAAITPGNFVSKCSPIYEVFGGERGRRKRTETSLPVPAYSSSNNSSDVQEEYTEAQNLEAGWWTVSRFRNFFARLWVIYG
jgi:hypothetical protein